MRLGMAYGIAAAGCLMGLFLMIAGCSESSTATPSTFPVKGKVTYKGQQLTSGQVHFEPEGPGREAFGEIQPDGTYELSTYGKGDGAVVGPHRVSVTGSVNKAKLPLKYGSAAAAKIDMEVSAEKTDYPITLQ